MTFSGIIIILGLILLACLAVSIIIINAYQISLSVDETGKIPPRKKSTLGKFDREEFDRFVKKINDLKESD